ncbi:hypothetical protein NQ318_000016 [Aromia moschata]|uniref:Uncharacterized protein n=1 Tax=Aromia moschata TaxID=1265417 RepID=A0AAV8YA53_9CUCU|nr:hypothetical protein NQ318_000016 [Aromia moschata]
MRTDSDCSAEKQKCALLQRKMAELRSKARELQRSAAEAQTEHAAKDKIHKVFDGSASKSQLRDILKGAVDAARPAARVKARRVSVGCCDFFTIN